MSDFEDTYTCPWCDNDIDLRKTKLDILLRKFDINEVLIKCNNKVEELEMRLNSAESLINTIDLMEGLIPHGVNSSPKYTYIIERYKREYRVRNDNS